ncbi:MAG: hypothetical protein H7A35_10715 [Planctomycetales bacterium]|nr:hypothetical protein [bacterium]UNM07341.1 MAG: hypothetical protein H7A35_10715 [Planctomycetales bacterium]
MRNFCGILLGCLLLLLLCGCPPRTGGSNAGNGNKQPVSNASIGGTVRLPLEIAPDDPDFAAMDLSQQRLYALARAVGVNLTAPVTGKDEVKNSLATGVEVNVDGSMWLFKLPEQDDPLLLPGQVRSRITAIANGPRSMLHAQVLDLIEGARDVESGKALDISGILVTDNSIGFKLTRPYMQFDSWLSQPGLSVVDIAVTMDADDPALVADASSNGYGPWKIDRMEQDEAGVSELVLVPNPDSLLGQPVATELRFVLEPDREKQVQLFRDGRLDAANIPTTMVGQLGNDPELGSMLSSHETAVSLLALFDHGQDPWGDQLMQDKVGLRRSLALSIDRETLEEENNGQVQGWSHFLPRHFNAAIPMELMNNPSFPQTAMLEEARKAQKDSDHEQGTHLPVNMDIAFLNYDNLESLDRDLLQFWSDISIRLQPFPLSNVDLLRRIDLNSHEVIVFWNYPAWPDAGACIYPQLYSPLIGNGANYSRISIPEVDEAILEAQATDNEQLRNLYLGNISRIIEEKGLFVPAAYASPSLLLNPKLAASPGPYDFNASLQGQDFAAIGISLD